MICAKYPATTKILGNVISCFIFSCIIWGNRDLFFFLNYGIIGLILMLFFKMLSLRMYLTMVPRQWIKRSSRYVTWICLILQSLCFYCGKIAHSVCVHLSNSTVFYWDSQVYFVIVQFIYIYLVSFHSCQKNQAFIEKQRQCFQNKYKWI